MFNLKIIYLIGFFKKKIFQTFIFTLNLIDVTGSIKLVEYSNYNLLIFSDLLNFIQLLLGKLNHV